MNQLDVVRPDDPAWLALLLAALHTDTREVPGVGMNPFIAGLYREHGLDPLHYQDDTHPWCAICATGILKRVGYRPWNHIFAARGALDWGQTLKDPVRGCFAILNRIDPKQPNVLHAHVTCYLGSVDAMHFRGVGGNQHNRLGADPYELSRILGWRMPILKLGAA